jgi:hypothetical protein
LIAYPGGQAFSLAMAIPAGSAQIGYIIHKSSSVLNEEPSSAQLEDGELFVNNASGGPFFAIKLSDGTVHRVSVASSGSANVPSGATAPLTGLLGDLFLLTPGGTQPNTLVVYSGAAWVTSVPGTAPSSATPPPNPTEGALWIDTAIAGDPIPKIYDGTSWQPMGGGGAGTDLTYDSTTRTIASSTGTDAILPVGSATVTGLVKSGTGLTIAADGTVSIDRTTSDTWYAADLTYDSATGTIESSTGTDAVIAVSSDTVAGLSKSGNGLVASADGTLDIVAATDGGIAVNAGDIEIDRTVTDTWYATAAQGDKADLAVPSDVTGITGAARIINMISLDQASYDAIATPDSATLYVILP